MASKHTFTVTGELLEVGPIQTFGAKGFQKRRLVIETSADPDKWTNPVAVSLTKDRVTMGDHLKVGSTLAIEGYVDGRRWDGPKGTQFFVDLVAASVMIQGEQVATPTDSAPASQGDPDTLPEADEIENMPF